MSSCDGEVKSFRERFPDLDKRMARLAVLENTYPALTRKEVMETLARWTGNKEVIDAYDIEEIDKDLIMIERGAKGKKIVAELEEKPEMKGKIGILWMYMDCITTGKTMSAELKRRNKGGRRRRRRSTKKKKRKRRKRNSKKRTRRRIK